MATVVSTPPALRWVALFLAGCAVLGLYLGFRDQIRRNPPGWYTGVEQVAVPVGTATDGIREAAPFDPDAAAPATRDEPAAPKPESKAEAAEAAPAVPPPTLDDAPVAMPPPVAPPARTVETPSRPRPAPQPPAKAPASDDPVGDILEGRTAEPQVPY